MAIVRLDPLNILDRPFFRPMFSDWDNEWPELKMTEGLDVYEENDRVVVKAAVPGIKPDSVKVTFEDGVLHIFAREEGKEEQKEKKKVVYRKERVTSFDYLCTLPRAIDADKLTAEVENGVLMITAPVAPAAQSKSIPVKVRK